MIRAADHVLATACRAFRRPAPVRPPLRVALRGRVGIEQFRSNVDAAASRHSCGLRRSCRSTRSRRSPSMSRTSISMRTRLGMLLTAPGKTSQTPTVATVSMEPRGARRRFHRQRDFRRRQECVVPVRHEHRAGMAAFAFDGRCCRLAGAAIAVTTPIGDFVPLEQRSLLDVQLDERRIVSGRQAHRPTAAP